MIPDKQIKAATKTPDTIPDTSDECDECRYDIELFVLDALSRGLSSGNRIQRNLVEIGAPTFDQQNVYRYLRMMERDGLITRKPSEDSRRTINRMTPRGVERLSLLWRQYAVLFKKRVRD